MKRISWVHIFLGRQEQPTELSLYVCPEEDPWYIDGILDVRLPAYRDDGPTLDRAVDPEIRGLVLDDVQESVEQNAESVESARGWDDYTFERFCEEFGCTPMDVYHVRTRSSGTGTKCDIQVAICSDEKCPDAIDARVRKLALEHLGLTADQVVFDKVYPADDMVRNQPVVVDREREG